MLTQLYGSQVHGVCDLTVLLFLFRVCAQELELVDDVWRGEVQDLLSQITRLQAENKRLLVSISPKESPVTQEDLQKQEGGWSAPLVLNQGLTESFLEPEPIGFFGADTDISADIYIHTHIHRAATNYYFHC